MKLSGKTRNGDEISLTFDDLLDFPLEIRERVLRGFPIYLKTDLLNEIIELRPDVPSGPVSQSHGGTS